MTMIEPHTDLDDMLRVPAAWSKDVVPAQPECVCPESCLIDHNN